MPIKVSCHCGQSFMAKDELIGQTLLCPKCHDPITIGEGSQQQRRQGGGGMEDLFDEAGIKEAKGHRCPKCMAELKPNAILCVACGFNLQTGDKIEGVKVRVAGQRGHGEAADVLLERAAQTIAEDKAEELKTRKQGLPAWVYLLALLGLGGFAVAMFLIPREQAFSITGLILIGFAWLASMYYQIRILIVAFTESWVCGLLYLFLPFYWLYYLVTRWDDVGGFFLMQLACLGPYLLGWLMLVIAPAFAESEEDQVGMSAVRCGPQYAAVVFAGESETWTA
jgi:hypothetical protein